MVIASNNHGGVLKETFSLQHQGRKMGNYVDQSGQYVGFALTPGYETYEGLGWYGVIVQGATGANS